MAADEALLEHVGASGRPALRFYTWDPPTLSLGYFQPYTARLNDPGLAKLAVVRRPTGGGAIVHHHELTYALALPATTIWHRGANWTCRMHDVIRVALAPYGVPAAACGPGEEVGRGAFLCFQHRTPGDVLLGDRKVVGSAQRRRAGALLQHGSILLAASEHAPHLGGILELLGVAIAADRLADELARTFAHVTGWALLPAEWSPGLTARRDEIKATRYANPAWTERR
jgi:lipoate-protein ligase A